MMLKYTFAGGYAKIPILGGGTVMLGTLGLVAGGTL